MRAAIFQLFYKYASPATALAILRSRAFRYSSPLLFNDPFDFQSGLHLDFEIDRLLPRILDRLQVLAAQELDVQVDREDPWGQVVDIVRRNYATHGFPRQAFAEMTGPLFRELAEQIRTTQQQCQNHWRNQFLPRLRVFCVSEERDNLLMWAHYARDHTGVVFELRSLPEEDNPLSVAKPVIYCDLPPPFFTEAEWIDYILSIKRLDHQELNRRYAYSKSVHWSYEREWRLWDLRDADALWSDYPIQQNEFSAVYIGCRADASFTREVISLTRGAFPHARVYQAAKNEVTYGLTYADLVPVC